MDCLKMHKLNCCYEIEILAAATYSYTTEQLGHTIEMHSIRKGEVAWTYLSCKVMLNENSIDEA